MQRGPRLCAAPDHAPRHAPRAHAGHAATRCLPVGAGPGRRDGRTPIRSWLRAESLITETLRQEEERFQATLERGMELLEEETGSARAASCRATRVQALRHLRLPGRPHRGHRCAAGPGRPRRLRGGDGAAARAGARRLAGSGEAATERLWFDQRERSGRPSSWATTPSARGRVVALVVDGGHGRGARRRARTRSDPRPHAVLRRVRRPGRRHRHDHRRRRRVAVTDTQKKPGALFVHEGLVARARSQSATRWRRGSTTSAAARSAPTTRRPICCMRRCAGGSDTMWSRRARLVAPERLRFDFRQPTP